MWFVVKIERTMGYSEVVVQADDRKAALQRVFMSPIFLTDQGAKGLIATPVAEIDEWEREYAEIEASDAAEDEGA